MKAQGKMNIILIYSDRRTVIYWMILMQTIPIYNDSHAIVAAYHGHQLARTLGFSLVDQTAISTAILEVARNIVKYAYGGEVTLEVIYRDDTLALFVTAKDKGPGIHDLELALTDGFSTGKSLGLGLPGARRLMSAFEIESVPGYGTTVRLQKWKQA